MDERLSVMAVDESTGRIAGAAIIHDFGREDPKRVCIFHVPLFL
jgi:hypothetical protein